VVLTIFQGAGEAHKYTYWEATLNSFESIIKLLLEEENFWVRQSEKINLTPKEKAKTGKPSIPRPEIDLVAYNQNENRLYAIEVKSFLDSRGVIPEQIKEQHKTTQGIYKLFTCANYRNIVFGRLKKDFVKLGLANSKTEITLGLAAGKIDGDRFGEMKDFFGKKGWFYWGPPEIKKRIYNLAKKAYEDDPVIMAAKLLTK